MAASFSGDMSSRTTDWTSLWILTMSILRLTFISELLARTSKQSANSASFSKIVLNSAWKHLLPYQRYSTDTSSGLRNAQICKSRKAWSEVRDSEDRETFQVVDDAGSLCTMKNFYISAREIYGLYILNLIETSRKKQLLIMFSMRFRSVRHRIF